MYSMAARLCQRARPLSRTPDADGASAGDSCKYPRRSVNAPCNQHHASWFVSSNVMACESSCAHLDTTVSWQLVEGITIGIGGVLTVGGVDTRCRRRRGFQTFVLHLVRALPWLS